MPLGLYILPVLQRAREQDRNNYKPLPEQFYCLLIPRIVQKPLALFSGQINGKWQEMKLLLTIFPFFISPTSWWASFPRDTQQLPDTPLFLRAVGGHHLFSLEHAYISGPPTVQSPFGLNCYLRAWLLYLLREFVFILGKMLSFTVFHGFGGRLDYYFTKTLSSRSGWYSGSHS